MGKQNKSAAINIKQYFMDGDQTNFWIFWQYKNTTFWYFSRWMLTYRWCSRVAERSSEIEASFHTNIHAHMEQFPGDTGGVYDFVQEPVLHYGSPWPYTVICVPGICALRKTGLILSASKYGHLDLHVYAYYSVCIKHSEALLHGHTRISCPR